MVKEFFISHFPTSFHWFLWSCFLMLFRYVVGGDGKGIGVCPVTQYSLWRQGLCVSSLMYIPLLSVYMQGMPREPMLGKWVLLNLGEWLRYYASKGLNIEVMIITSYITVMAIGSGWGLPTPKTQIIFVLLFPRHEATFPRWESQYWSFPDWKCERTLLFTK